MTQTHFGGRGPGYVTAYLVPPSNTVAPAISGTAEVDETLTCSTGIWLRASLTFAYQWKRDGVAISDATASSYVLVTADGGTTVSATVTASNAVGSAAANATGVAVDEFDPLSLSPTAWYDPSDMATLFQDSAGTTPVTASGQPVGKMLDLSGNGHHRTQGTAAARPIYTESGGVKFLQFDGVDDGMTDAALALGAAFERITAVRSSAAGDTGVWWYSGSGYEYMFDIVVGGTFRTYVNTPAAAVIAAAVANNTDAVMVERIDAANSRAKVDGGAYGTGTLGTPAFGAGTRLNGGFAGEAVDGRFYGSFLRSGVALTDPQIAQLLTYYGEKQGRVL